jgi:quercetin dioxygenase-like cupin family protein
LNAYYAEFPPLAPDKRRRHQHGGVELIYVLRGSLELSIGKEEHTLEEGDALYFDASVPHGYRRSGKKPTAAIVVSVP